MPRTCFSIGSHDLALAVDLSGKHYIIYDNKIVSQRWQFGLSTTHHFEASENGETAKYDITFKGSLSGLVEYTVKRNKVLVKKGTISPMTGGILRIYFFSVGLGLVTIPSTHLIWPKFHEFIVSQYASSGLTWLYINLGYEFILGILFLIFAFLLKRILVKSPKFITTVLWFHIGLMIITSPLLLANSMQEQQFLDYRFVILRAFLIWVYWSILKNCQEIAKELKFQSSLPSNHTSRNI